MQNSKSRLKEKYEKEISKKIAQEFDVKNSMAVPKLTKISVNMGIGEISKNKELRESLTRDLSTITGQRPSVRRARVSIASFNLRAGMPVGLATTLRGDKMYNFFDKLVSIVLPRLRDFRGVSLNSFDKSGNYSIGLREYTIFPEIDIAKTPNPKSLEITIVTNAGSPERSRRLLELLGMPFEKNDK